MKRIVALVLCLLLTAFAVAESDMWVCPECGKENMKNFCANDGQPRPTIAPEWGCRLCGYTNEAESSFCEICGSAYGSISSISMKAEIEAIRIAEVGDIVTMGYYGGEDVEWLVLATEGDTRTMIAVKGQDAVCFNKSIDDGNEWESSYIRTWLNGTYYNSAFSAKEQAIIVSGPSGDKIWLLSKDEAMKYFADDAARVCYPTDYAKNNGAFTSDSIGTGVWWLRSPGSDNDTAAVVHTFGIVYNKSLVYSVNAMARPVVIVSVGLSN